MGKEYMVGTVDDKPLLIVVMDGTTYFADKDAKRVYEDKPGLPEVKDKKLVKAVLKGAL